MSRARVESVRLPKEGYSERPGVLGFGGPVALVGQMEREIVTERR